MEFWNNGYNRETGWWEFKGTTYTYQQWHLEQGQTLARGVLGFPFTAFGAPFNTFDSITAQVVSESPDIEVWLYGPPSGTQEVILPDTSADIESSWGVPSYSWFLSTYIPTDEIVVLQHEPYVQTFRDSFSEFNLILDYLIAQNVTFILPTEYARLIKQGIFPIYPDADTDGDGIPDGVEGQGDTDNDGIPDFLDAEQ